MYGINTKEYQFIIDVLFGFIVILPLILYQLHYLPEKIILFSIGAGFGYVLHVSQKMLVFNEVMEDVVKEKAQIAVDEKTEKEFNITF